jgi:SAM-dependent methyltransferase
MNASKCLICNNESEYYFTKNFSNFPTFNQLDYWKCKNCGFVYAKNYYELSTKDFEKANEHYHSLHQGSSFCEDDVRWLERLENQSSVIKDLFDNKVIPNGNWVDYGCGDGKLSDSLKTKFSLNLKKFDRYMIHSKEHMPLENLKKHSFDFALSTSVLEHLREKKYFKEFFDLVKDNGVLGLHTLVCEQIPKDPNWFYLLPVHCSLFSNKSIEILFEEFGFKFSIYNVEARIWFWFKQGKDEIKATINKLNKRKIDKLHYIFKDGFVDYWK